MQAPGGHNAGGYQAFGTGFSFQWPEIGFRGGQRNRTRDCALVDHHRTICPQALVTERPIALPPRRTTRGLERVGGALLASGRRVHAVVVQRSQCPIAIHVSADGDTMGRSGAARRKETTGRIRRAATATTAEGPCGIGRGSNFMLPFPDDYKPPETNEVPLLAPPSLV
jgi:hypothetical protein